MSMGTVMTYGTALIAIDTRSPMSVAALSQKNDLKFQRLRRAHIYLHVKAATLLIYGRCQFALR